MKTQQHTVTGAPLALYLHIPFCRFRCYYCDFNTYAGIEPLLPAYVEALATEVRRWGQALRSVSGIQGPATGDKTSPAHPEPVEGRAGPRWERPSSGPEKVRVASVFLGGGTPSLLSPAQLERILTAIADAFALSPEAEITLEANPESVEPGKTRAYRALGVNRVSMGAQSFDDAELRMLGRLHDSARLTAAYAELRTAGAQNVNLDLIYGLPRQTRRTWARTLAQALALEPDHLSLYALTVEERTPFHAWVQEGTLPSPDPDLAADMYEDAAERLAAAGYRQYEISNWARPGRECRHNLVYWRNGPFIGAGPGAHSYLWGARFAITPQPREYIAAIAGLEQRGPPPLLSLATRLAGPGPLRAVAPVDGFDPISEDLERRETLILGLRLNEGVSLAGYRARFGASPLDLFAEAVQESIADGLLALEDGVLRLTPRGRLLANEVFVRVLAGSPRLSPGKGEGEAVEPGDAPSLRSGQAPRHPPEGWRPP